LQHLGHDTIAELLLRKRKEFLVRTTHRVARCGVEQEVFFFHPERVHARNNCSDGTLFRLVLWRKNGRRRIPRRPGPFRRLLKCSPPISSSVCRSAKY
jgi:hypothetical protein